MRIVSEKIELNMPTDQDIDDVIVYLKGLYGLKGRFEHLNRNQTKKVNSFFNLLQLFSEFECKFYNKGEYLFN